MIIEEYIGSELDSLKRSIVATPETRESLDAFSKANQGSMDYLLTQMAVQYGYTLALNNIKQQLNEDTIKSK